MYRKAVREAAISEENPSSSGRMVLLRYYSSTSRNANPSGFPFVEKPPRNFSAGWRLVFMQMALCNTFSRRSKTQKHSSYFPLFFPILSLYYYTVIFVSLIFVSFIYIETIISFFYRNSSNVPSIL